MGLAYYIALDTEDPGFEIFVNGNFLAHDSNQINAICQNLKIRTLDDFLVMSEDDIADILGEDFDLPELEDEKWFSAEEGLIFVNVLSKHIENNPKDVMNSKGVLQDLSEYGDLFRKVKKNGAKWHLCLNI